MITFYHYMEYFNRSDPREDVSYLNKSLGSDRTKMSVAMSLANLHETDNTAVLDFITQTLGIPTDVCAIWFPDGLTSPSIPYIVYCSVITTLKNITPLIRAVDFAPELFREFMCVYNKVWAVGDVIVGHHQCHEAIRLRDIIETTVGSTPDVGTPWTFKMTSNCLRQYFGLPAREFSDLSSKYNINAVFNNFTIPQLK